MQAFYNCLLVVLVGSLIEARYYLDEGNVIENVKKVINNANQILEKSSLAEISTPDLYYDNLISSGNIKNARFGKLSTLLVAGEKQFLNKTSADVTVHYYDLSLSLEQFLVSYDFQYRFLFVLHGSGHAEILAKNNVAQLTGAVTKRADGSCSGVLYNAVLNKLSDFEATITPKTVGNSLLAIIMQFAKNYILPSDLPIFNELISQGVQSEYFKKIFSEIACQSFKDL